MQPELEELLEKSHGEKTAHETTEILLAVKALSGDKNPVLFLLNELRRLNDDAEWMRRDIDRYSKINDWVNNDRAHQHMCGGRLGAYCSDIVLDYMERTFKENETEIRASLAASDVELHAWCEERRRQVAAERAANLGAL